MPQRGQEPALGLRGLFGQLLLVHGQLPLLATAQARTDRPDQDEQQQRTDQDVAEDRHAAAPPGWQHLHLQLLRRRPRTIGGGRLHFDDVAAGRQSRQRALAVAALLHPVLVIPAYPEAVAVALGIGIRQQPCIDLQVAIIRSQQQGAGVRQRLPAACIVAAHAHLGNHQRRPGQHHVVGIHVECNQAGLGDGQNATIGIHRWRPAGELGIGQAIAFIEQLQASCFRVPAQQAARRGRPHPAIVGQCQAPHADRRHTGASINALDQAQAHAIPLVALQRALAGQPQLLRIHPHQVVDQPARDPRHRFEATGLLTPDAHVAHHPCLAMGIEADLLDG